MALLTPAYVTVNPSFMEPELLLPYNQSSGAFDCLPDAAPRVKLDEGDLLHDRGFHDRHSDVPAAGPRGI
jgi:hypothetical protein